MLLKTLAQVKILCLGAVLLQVPLIALAEKTDKVDEGKKEASAASAASAPAEASKKLGKSDKDKVPDKFRAVFVTTKGDFEVEFDKAAAPKGVARMHELLQTNFFKDIAFFRAIDGFVVQFGIPGNPKDAAKWRAKAIDDDPVVKSNEAGSLVFATSGPNSRTTQLFINLKDNKRLDSMGFSPIGKVVKGMDVVKNLYTGYGEGAPMGTGPAQDLIQMEGNKYLKKSFPKLDYIKSAKILR